MATYRLVVHRKIPITPEQERQMRTDNNYPINRGGYGSGQAGQPFHENQVLDIEVNEEEWEAIKKAAINVK